MGVVESNGTFLVSTTSIDIISDANKGVHEGWLYFNNLGVSDVFEVTIEVQNPFRSTLVRTRKQVVNYTNTTNGLDAAWHLKPVYSPHYKVKIIKTAGSDRDIDFYKLRYV